MTLEMGRGELILLGACWALGLIASGFARAAFRDWQDRRTLRRRHNEMRRAEERLKGNVKELMQQHGFVMTEPGMVPPPEQPS